MPSRQTCQPSFPNLNEKWPKICCPTPAWTKLYMFLMIEGKFLFPKGFISLTLMGGEKEAIAGAGVSLSPPPYPSCVQDYKCGTWTTLAGPQWMLCCSPPPQVPSGCF